MDEINSKLAALSIRVLSGDDGLLTVISNSEPYFCFVRSTEDEISQVVSDTLKSYAKYFYNHDLEVELAYEHPTAPLPTVRLTPQSTVRPTFGRNSGEFAFV